MYKTTRSKVINFLKIVLLFLQLEVSGFNPSYDGTDAEVSFETFFIKDRLIKEDYIKYFPYYQKWVEKFDHVDISLINIADYCFPYNQLKRILPFNNAGWYYNAQYIKKLFEHNTIETALEIGSYLGVSTRHIAALLPDKGKVYAVDTFNVLKHHYEQFLSNMIISGLSYKVIPIKQYSNQAINIFINLHQKFDFIYVDAGHEVEEVLCDLENYYPMLTSKGIMCGDDWLWSSVRSAVKQFAQKYELTIYGDCNFWFLKKEDDGYSYKSFLNAEDGVWRFN